MRREEGRGDERKGEAGRIGEEMRGEERRGDGSRAEKEPPQQAHQISTVYTCIQPCLHYTAPQDKQHTFKLLFGY